MCLPILLIHAPVLSTTLHHLGHRTHANAWLAAHVARDLDVDEGHPVEEQLQLQLGELGQDILGHHLVESFAHCLELRQHTGQVRYTCQVRVRVKLDIRVKLDEARGLG